MAQLAYIFRVFTDTGTLQTDNLSTARQEEISLDSIRNNFYKPSAAAKESVLDLLVKQVSYVRKDIG